MIHRGWNTFGIATLTLPDGSAVRRALERVVSGRTVLICMRRYVPVAGVVTVAVMRKLIEAANLVLGRGQPWLNQPAT